MREVEAQAVRLDERACLVHMVAEDLLQGCIEQVRRRMVAADELTPAMIDRAVERIPDMELAFLDGCHMGAHAALALRVRDCKACRDAGKRASIADLAAHLGVERRPVEHDLDLVSCLSARDLFAVRDDGKDLRTLELVGIIARELRLRETVGKCRPDVVGLAPGIAVRALACALLLGIHGSLEGVHIDSMACGLGDLAGEVDREAIRVVEPEGHVSGKLLALAELFHLGGKHRLACIERATEALLLGSDDAVDEGLVLDELRIDIAQNLRHFMRIRREERALDAEQASVIDSTAQEPPQDIATALVRRQDAVADHERDSTGVVCQDAQALVGGKV